eukprot:COSAG02_NODE_9622_length_2158_cov_1.908694_2_plen_196_part_00
MYAEIIKRGKFEAGEEETLALAGSTNLPPNITEPPASAGAQVPHSQDLTLNPSYRQLSSSRLPPRGSPATSDGKGSRRAIAGGGGGMVLDRSPSQSRAKESAKQHVALLESVKRTSTLRMQQRDQDSSVDPVRMEGQRHDGGDGDTSESEDDLPPALVPSSAAVTMTEAHGAQGNAGPRGDQSSSGRPSTLHADV